jgi:nitric-oxide synthase
MFRGIPPRELVRFFAEVRDRGTLTVPTESAALCLEMAGTTYKVTFEQLVSVINQVRVEGLETGAYVKAMFDRVDTDQSGTLSVPELTDYLGSLGFSEAEAAAITKEADQNQDGEISLAEFQSGITPMIEAALADAPSTVRLLTVPRVAFVDDVVAWGVSRADAEAFASYLESAGSGDTCQVHPIADSDLASLLTPYLAELVGVYILPGTGVYRARSTTMEGRPGRHVHISTPAQGDMHIRYTQDGSYRNAAWTDVSTDEAPTLQFEDEAAGVVRKFWISNHQLRALETIGPWDESSEAIALLRSGRAIPAWQLAVMRDRVWRVRNPARRYVRKRQLRAGPRRRTPYAG